MNQIHPSDLLCFWRLETFLSVARCLLLLAVPSLHIEAERDIFEQVPHIHFRSWTSVSQKRNSLRSFICLVRWRKMTNFRINVEQEDPDLRARNAVLDIGFKHLRTPCRAFNLTTNKDSESLRIVNREIRGFNEVYKKLNRASLQGLASNVSRQQQFVMQVTGLISQKPTELTLVYIEYDARQQTPSEQEIEYLFDLLYGPLNDAVVPPILRGSSPEAYLDFLEKFFLISRSYNRKPTFGLIPYGAYQDLDPVLSFYVNEGIRLFIMDLNGRHPLIFHPHIVRVTRKLDEVKREYNEDYYLHALNVGFGRALRSKEVVPAKDILSIVYGFDSFGPTHVPPRLPPDVYGRLGKLPKYLLIRLFDRRNYGYYRVDLVDTKGAFTTEGNVAVNTDSFKQIIDMRSMRALRRVFNAERHGLETTAIRQKLKEGELLRYVESKRHVEKELKKVKKLAYDVKQTTLT